MDVVLHCADQKRLGRHGIYARDTCETCFSNGILDRTSRPRLTILCRTLVHLTGKRTDIG